MKKKIEQDYNHIIQGKGLINAICASDNEFAEKKKEYKKIGIERLSARMIRHKYTPNTPRIYPNGYSVNITFIQSASIQPSNKDLFLLKDIDNVSNPFFLWQCDLPKTEFCKYFLRNIETYPFFVLLNSKIQGLTIKKSITGVFHIENSTSGDFNIQQKSTVGKFHIKNSTIGQIRISDQSTAGRFSVQDNSTIEGFSIQDSSKTGGFGVHESYISKGFGIRDSNIGNFMISKSTIGGIGISDSTTGAISIQQESETGKLSICKSNTGYLMFLSDATIGNIRITESHTKRFAFGNSKIGDLFIQNSTTGNIHINNNSETGDLSINNCTTGIFSFKESTMGEFKLVNNSNIGHVRIENSSTEKIRLLSSTIERINIDSSQTGDIKIENSTTDILNLNKIVCSFSVTRTIVPEIQVMESHLLEVIIGIDCEMNLFIANSSINFINLRNSSIGSSSSLSLNNVNLYACLIEKLDNLGRVYFRGINAIDSEPVISDYFSKDQKDLILHNLTRVNEIFELQNSTFRISYSSLGATEFIDCELAKFGAFEFNNSRITEAFISGGSMPENNISIYNSKSKEECYDQMVSLFNQFSSIFQAQGHIYNAMNYRSKAAAVQMELLRKKKAWQDLIPFKLNAWSNQHGASWTKAFWFLLWTSYVLYVFALFSTVNHLHVFIFDNSFIGHYFDFLNPLRPFDFFEQIKLTPSVGTRFIDLLSRIVIGYGIYQLIAAFRRYGRK